ncbi:VOC family protein [Marinicella sp. S1101]|uniref:VOC family protein n=1 Tax=Marinicella marina TaxID=2996016 RepID=UPI002260A259|nr:VOC family protein [Marinicella marina]MCX7552516.1 VOC family protein [Marinicella marina]MDJ1139392.1 VOC family protein [Marinicella marina]
MRYAHTNLISHDWRKLARFYIDIFACEPVPPERNQSGEWLDQGTGIKNAALQGVHLRLHGHGENGPTLEIYQYSQTLPQSPVQPNQRGIGHLAFEVDDIIEVITAVLAGGGEKQGDLTTKTVPGLGVLSFLYVRDPEGNLIELQNWQKANEK